MGADPVSLSLLAGSTAMSIGGDISKAFTAKAAGEAEATEYEQQAAIARQSAGTKISSDDYQAINILNRIQSGTAASGFTSSGSARQVTEISGEEARINDMYTRYSGKLTASRDMYAANVARFQGNQAFASGIVGAGMTAVTSGLRGYKIFQTGQDPAMNPLLGMA